jgi:multiple sugar transport system substrate-binding protein
MGMDLIYAPQFENAHQLVDITGPDEGLAGDPGRQPGPQDRRDVRRPPVRRPALRRRLGPVLQQGPLHQGRLDPNKPPTSLAEIRQYADKITALGGGVTGYYLPGNCAGCNIFTSAR